MSTPFGDPRDPRKRVRYIDGGDYPVADTPEYLITIRDTAEGTVLDVSDRIRSGGLGRITETTEEDLLQLAHGDLTLTLDNVDGVLDRFFDDVGPDDVFEIQIDQRAPAAARTRWTRIFTGILDLPWSLRFDRVRRTARVQAFSFSKYLEKSSAEPVKRSIVGVTGSVASGNNLVTLTSTSGLHTYDEITLTSGGVQETQTVKGITSSTQLRTFENWSNAFSAGSVFILETPYYRNRSPEALAIDLFAQAGVDDYRIALDHGANIEPFPTPVSDSGLGRASDGTFDAIRLLTIWDGILKCRIVATSYQMGGDGAPDDAGWGSVTGTDPVQTVDWTSQTDTEPTPPTNLVTLDINGVGDIDYASDDGYESFVDGGTNLWRLKKNGVEIYNYNGGSHSVANYHAFNAASGYLMYSRVSSTANGRALMYWDGAVMNTIDGTTGGMMRYLHRLGVFVLHARATGSAGPGSWSTELRVYDAATMTYLRSVTVPDGLIAWSLRVFGDRIAGVYNLAGRTRLAVWDLDWNLTESYEISDQANTGGVVVATVWRDPDTSREVYVGMCQKGSVAFVVGRYYAGIVPYANFEGLSCGGALRELALITAAYVDVDRNKRGALIARSVEDQIRRENPIGLGRCTRRESWPIWEFYRSSARITGRDSTGADVEAIRGQTGDSQRRFDVDGKLITQFGMADAVAALYAGFLSQTLRQEDVDVDEEFGREIHVFDYVSFDGRVWVVVEASYLPSERRYSLRLVEAKEAA